MRVNGEVTATQILSLRFAQSGKLASINCAPGNLVKRGQLLASLNQTELQTQLDIELADFRRVRAEFDKLSREISEPKTEDEKTLKEIMQSRLEVSTKTVEKVKQQMDGLKLICPIDAVVLSTSGLINGVNVTPSGFPVEVADVTSVVFAVSVDEGAVYQIKPETIAQIELKNGQRFESKVTFISPAAEKGKFTVFFPLPPLDLTNFRLGTTGSVNF